MTITMSFISQWTILYNSIIITVNNATAFVNSHKDYKTPRN